MKMLKYLREQAGLTQNDLSDRIGASQTTISNWEKGDLDYEESLINVAKFFNVSVGYLLGVEDSEGIIKYAEDALSVSDKKLLFDFHAMPPERQAFIREIVEKFAQEKKYMEK